MQILNDYRGVRIRLTDERLNHILEHPEMMQQEKSIIQTLKEPELVVQSKSDENVRLYYRSYQKLSIGDKYLCVVVKTRDEDVFIVTAYFTDRPKRGTVLWKR
jgi:hypothetical protein